MSSVSERIINYASVFTYFPGLRNDFIDYKPNLDKYESECSITPGAGSKLTQLLDDMDTD
jgi:hypothetical protein